MCDLDGGSDIGIDSGLDMDTDTSEDISFDEGISDSVESSALDELPDVPDSVDTEGIENELDTSTDEGFPSLDEYSEAIEESNSIDELMGMREALQNGEFSDSSLEDVPSELCETNESESDVSELVDIPFEEPVEMSEQENDIISVPETNLGVEEIPEESETVYLENLQEELTQVYGIPEDSPELAAIMQNEQTGWEEVHECDSIENISEENPNETAEAFTEVPEGTDNTSEEITSEMNVEIPEDSEEGLNTIDDNIEANETGILEAVQQEISEESDILEENPENETVSQDEQAVLEGITEESIGETVEDLSGEITSIPEEVVIDDLNTADDTEETAYQGYMEIPHGNSTNTEEIVEDDFVTEEIDEIELSEQEEMGEFEEQLFEVAEEVEETQDISDMENGDADPEALDINYEDVYECTDSDHINEAFENIDIAENSDRLDSTLENFQQETWDELSLEEQKESMSELADYVVDTIGFANPPHIEYYNNPEQGDYGAYSSETNTLLVNEFMLGDSAEAADTVAHELWHAHQRECANNPSSLRDYQYMYNFENYIRPEWGHEEYQNQLVEAEARAFAQQFKGRLVGLKE